MAEREPLPPGVLPHITDTDPPPLHPATIVRDGYTGIDEGKLHPAKRHAPNHGRQEPAGRE